MKVSALTLVVAGLVILNVISDVWILHTFSEYMQPSMSCLEKDLDPYWGGER